MKTPLILALSLALGVAGVLAGTALRGRVVATHTFPEPETALETGAPLPAVELVGEQGERRLSSELFGAEGGVVLFLELECPPCVESARHWQDMVNDGRVDVSSVAGITAQPLSAIAEFRSAHAIDFPIFRDEAYRFMKEYRVNQYPVKVVVDGDGIIRRIGGDITAAPW